MADTELKPCPFCGGEALIFFDPDKDAATIRCDGCSVETQHDKTRLMIETWNRRVATRPVSDEAVEAALIAWFGDDPWHIGMANEIVEQCRKSMQEALRAALSSHTGKPTVKPLEWTPTATGGLSATPPYWRDGYTIWNKPDGWHSAFMGQNAFQLPVCDSLADVKAACQADYEARILSALQTGTET